MTDKEKLIDILKGAERKVKDINPNMPLNEWLDIYADHLIAEGVIVPPCKVGDVVYRIANDSKTITEERIGEIRLEFTIDDGTGWHNHTSIIDKWLFC